LIFGPATLRRGFALADRFVPEALLQKLTPDSVLASAGVGASPDAQLGLETLLAAIAADSRLSLFGRLSTHWDMKRLLRNAAMVDAAHQRDPGLAAAPITAPVFILGLPRSGTTFLHSLMAEDVNSLVPRNWQTIYPAPRPKNFDPAHDSQARAVDRQLAFFAQMAPGFADLHPITADSPQECSEITAHVFQSLRFDTTFRVPGYLTWLEAHGHEAAFAFHKRFLQFLQNGTPSRWVLKCPDHTFSLDAILATYPDARFVIVHRDPLAVFASVARLTEVLRKPFLQNIDPVEIGAQVSARWIQGANLLRDFDSRPDIAPDRKFHVQHETLIADPLTVMAAIYAQFGMAFSAKVMSAVTAKLRAQAHGGYTRHAPYPVQAFGVSPERLTAAFAPYVREYCQ
jgi:hypothetical protein